MYFYITISGNETLINFHGTSLYSEHIVQNKIELCTIEFWMIPTCFSLSMCDKWEGSGGSILDKYLSVRI